MQERGKEDKMRGGGGCEKKIDGGGMPERVKKTKCGGGGSVAIKIEGGGVCRRGAKKTKCGGAKKIWGVYSGEGKEDKMLGGCGKKIERGGGLCRRG